MEIITIRKEGLICSLCGKGIAPDGEAIKFFNTGVPSDVPLRLGHILLGNNRRMHFRHLDCQYKSNFRKETFEEYVKKLRFQIELTKNKKKFKDGTLKNEK